MKRLFAVLFAIVLMLCVCAYAAEVVEVAADVAQGAGAIEEIAESGLPAEPFDWASIATISGATLATLLIVQLLKLPLDKLWKIPTRIWVYIIALILMLAATHFTSGLNFSSACLTAVNAVIVALSAMGAYELTFAKMKKKEQPPDAV